MASIMQMEVLNDMKLFPISLPDGKPLAISDIARG
jgi:hypothetical protein